MWYFSISGNLSQTGCVLKRMKDTTISIVTVSEDQLRSIIREELIIFKEELIKNLPNNDYDPDERITRKNIKDLYKISLATVHALMSQGLPYEKVGRKTLFKRGDVDEFFKERKNKLS